MSQITPKVLSAQTPHPAPAYRLHQPHADDAENPDPFLTTAQLDHAQTVLEILFAPLLLSGRSISCILASDEKRAKMNIYNVSSGNRPWFSKPNRKRIVALGAAISGIDQLNWENTLLRMRIYPRQRSAHEVIQERVQLRNFCEHRGLDWAETSSFYDAFVDRIVKARNGT